MRVRIGLAGLVTVMLAAAVGCTSDGDGARPATGSTPAMAGMATMRPGSGTGSGGAWS